MDSKKSFFNKAVFLKNLSSNLAPGLLSIIVFMFKALPEFSGNLTFEWDKYDMYICCESYFFVAVITGILIGAIGFDFTHKGNSMSFYHSLPVKRTGIYFSIYLSNLVTVIGTVAVCTVFCSCLAASSEYGFKSSLLLVFLYYAIIEIMVMTITTLCMVISGRILFGGFFTLAFIEGFYIVEYAVLEIIDYLYCDLDSELLNSGFGIVIFKPNSFKPGYHGCSYTSAIVHALILTVICFFVGLHLYKIRKSENFGNLIEFKKLFLPITAAFSIAGSILLTNTFIYLLEDISYSTTAKAIVMFTIIIIAFVIFFLINLIESRSLSFLCKRKVGIIAFVLITACIAFSFTFGIKYTSEYPPEEDEYDCVVLKVYGTSKMKNTYDDKTYFIVSISDKPENKSYVSKINSELIDDTDSLKLINHNYEEASWLLSIHYLKLNEEGMYDYYSGKYYVFGDYNKYYDIFIDYIEKNNTDISDYYRFYDEKVVSQEVELVSY